jgi:hypothetical protein
MADYRLQVMDDQLHPMAYHLYQFEIFPGDHNDPQELFSGVFFIG